MIVNAGTAQEARYSLTDESVKFCGQDGMAHYIWTEVMGHGNLGDEDESDGQGTGMARFGKRIIDWDDQGFVNLVCYDTVAEAEVAFETLRDENYYSECSRCGNIVHNDECSWMEHQQECVDEPIG